MESSGIVVLFEDIKWEWVLPRALAPQTQIIAANIVHREIRLVEEDFNRPVPISVVARLAYLLYKRFELFKGDHQKGINIITPFLSVEDVERLEAFVIELAHRNQYDPLFIDWLEHNNSFTN